MTRTTKARITKLASIAGALAVVACNDTDVSSTRAPLVVECAAPTDIPPGAWVCPDARTLSCNELREGTIFVAEGDALACESEPITLLDEGPFAPGVTHTITIESANGEACVSELTVIDETPPAIEAHTLHLWPPNHKLHTIDVEDCVTVFDDCDGMLQGEITWVSSDEPDDDTGDGNHAPDIIADQDCEHVALRAERQGSGDGRVYTVGVRVTDRSGNSAEGQCHVVVDHDQGDHEAIDSGEAQRVILDGTAGTSDCTEAVTVAR